MLVITLLTVGVTTLYAFVGPQQWPPDGNVGSPVTTGSETQIKTGDLFVNNLTANGSIVANNGNVCSVLSGTSYCLGQSSIPPIGSTFLNSGTSPQTKSGDLAVTGTTATSKIIADSHCIGTSCITSWPASGVEYLTAGTNINFGGTVARPVINATGGITAEADTLSSVMQRGSTAGGHINMNSNDINNVAKISFYTGTGNTYVGNYTPPPLSGNANTTVGFAAGNYITSGYGNTGVGYNTLMGVTTGTGNTSLGYMSGPWYANLDNTTAIGYGTWVTASNEVRLGNTAVTKIGGQVAWSAASDRRLKEDIIDYSHGLDFISKLRPVTFKFKSDNTHVVHSGFIAQEVEATKIPFYGINKPANEKDYYSLSYSEFVVPLVNAVKELKTENDKLKTENINLRKEMKEQNNDLLSRIEKLESKLK